LERDTGIMGNKVARLPPRDIEVVVHGFAVPLSIEARNGGATGRRR